MRSISADFSIASVQHYIEQHFQEELTVERLAELLHISPSNFNRVFKKETGLTPVEYLIEVRIEKSKSLLRRKDIPIIEVAERCGFGSSSHFASSFKRLTKVTPSEYRNSYEY
jgi:AraC-like DNA-binding protein